MRSYRRLWLSSSFGIPGPSGTQLAGTRGLGEALSPLTRRARLQQWQEDEAALWGSRELARLRGVTQVQIGQTARCNRFYHSIEVADLAHDMAQSLALDHSLARAIALGHDCGHVPFGHAGEEIVQAFMPGFHHATWGARMLRHRLGLSAEVTEGIANHSWHRPIPSTAEANLVRWADRIAYLTQDFADARAVGLVSDGSLPVGVRIRAGSSVAEQREFFCAAVVSASKRTGVVSMERGAALTLGEFRVANSELIYHHPRICEQADDATMAIKIVIRQARLVADRCRYDAEFGNVVQWLTSVDDATTLRLALSDPGAGRQYTWPGTYPSQAQSTPYRKLSRAVQKRFSGFSGSYGVGLPSAAPIR